MLRFTLTTVLAATLLSTSLWAQAPDGDEAAATELTAARTLSSKTFQEPDGSLTYRAKPRPVHYFTAMGELADIDTAVAAADVSDAPWALSCDTNTLVARFDGSRARVQANSGALMATAEPLRLSVTRNGREILVIAVIEETVPVAEGSLVRYPGALGGLDLVYEVKPSALGQSFVLDAAPALPATLDPAGLELTLIETVTLGEGVRFEIDRDGRIRAQIEGMTRALLMDIPVVFDASAEADRPGAPATGSLSVRVVEERVLEISNSVPLPYLLDADRVYPVTFDPDLILMPDPTIGKDSQLFAGSPSSNYGTRQYLTDNWGSADGDGIVEFDITPIPMGSQINTGTLTIYHNQNNESRSFGCHENQGAWDESTVTWNNSPTYDMTPTATVPPQGPSQDMIWDVTMSVDSMISGAITNYGWRLSAVGGANTAYLMSSDTATMSWWPELAINYDPGGINILTIDAPDTIVIAGLGGYAVSMTVENVGPNVVGINSVGLTFTGTADRTSEYTVTPDPANPTTVPALSQEILNFTVDVDIAATAETITIDGNIDVLDAITMASFTDLDADTPDMWDVLACLAPFCGDCNLDMMVSILDALVAAQHAAGLIILTGTQFSNCNVLGTLEPFPGATVDILDALNLAQAAAGLSVTLTCC